MIAHASLGNSSSEISRQLIRLIRYGKVQLAGNTKLRIYGTLHCRSGKRMAMQNRVFFASEEEALAAGYRPCAHCLPVKYHHWKRINRP